MMLAQIVLFAVDSVCGFLTLALLARFTLQVAKASFRNPLGQFVVAVTDWLVRPARRLIPGLFGLDMASLLLAWFWQAVYLGIALGLSGALAAVSSEDGFKPALIFMIAVLAVLETVKIGFYLMIGAVLVSAILSWVNPYAPLADVFNAVSQPLLRPFRRFIPPVGGVDLSPLALLLLLQVGMMVLERLRLIVLMP